MDFRIIVDSIRSGCRDFKFEFPRGNGRKHVFELSDYLRRIGTRHKLYHLETLAEEAIKAKGLGSEYADDGMRAWLVKLFLVYQAELIEIDKERQTRQSDHGSQQS